MDGGRLPGPGGMVINLCGGLTPRESAACFAKARAFLGHDSGPMHLADAVGTQCDCDLFGAESTAAVVSARQRITGSCITRCTAMGAECESVWWSGRSVYHSYGG